MKTPTTIACATAVLIGLSAIAVAQNRSSSGDEPLLLQEVAENQWGGPGRHHGRRGGRGGQAMMLRMLDTNMDNAVSMEEFMLLHDLRFKNADANNDGALDSSEIDAIVAVRADQMKTRMLERLDGDGDGQISAEEFATPFQERFSRLDRNDDGSIERSEMRRDRGGREGRERRRWRDN